MIESILVAKAITIAAVGVGLVLTVLVALMRVKAPIWVSSVLVLGQLIGGKSLEHKLIGAAGMLIFTVGTFTFLLLFFMLIDYAEYTRIERKEGFWSFRKKHGVTWKSL